MNVNLTAMTQTVTTTLTTVGLRLLGAIAIWIIGRRVIGIVLGVLGRALTKQSMDPTLIRYIHSAVAALLNVVMVIAILGFFGVETTSFAALIAAAGVAIGMAWSGLLSNFAGGVSFLAPTAGLLRSLDVALPEYQGGQDFLAAWDVSDGQFRPGFPAPSSIWRS